MSDSPQPPTMQSKRKLFLKLATVVGFIILIQYSGNRVVGIIEFQLWPQHEQMIITVLWSTVIIYILLMAIPFAPGIEVGLALMLMLGLKGVVLVYLCTLLSLALSFLIGRLIPMKFFAEFLAWLHMRNARDLLLHIEPFNPEQKLNFLLKTAPSRLIPLLLKHRYLMIAILLNLPGNALVGGGGGIGLIAGMSRLYPFSKFIMLIALAILPLPLFILAAKATE